MTGGVAALDVLTPVSGTSYCSENCTAKRCVVLSFLLSAFPISVFFCGLRKKNSGQTIGAGKYATCYWVTFFRFPATLSAMSQWLDHIETTMTGLLPEGQAVLVAVSGGLDSMVLFHALQEMAPRHGWQLVAAHFNHQLRGKYSDEDEQLVRKTARALNIPLAVGRGDVRAAAKRDKLSLEMEARQLRHAFLARSARRRKISVVALAHHAGDQVELFFLRLFRGAGSTGLGGMRMASPLPCDPAIQLIRPLLDQTKDALRAFAQERGIVFSEDATNASLDIQRNRIRNELIPLLEKHYQPGLSRTIPRLMEIAGVEGDFITQAAENWLQHLSTPFWQLPAAIQRRSLQLQLHALNEDADFELIEWLRLNPGKMITLNARTSAMRENWGTIWLFPPEPPVCAPAASCDLDLSQSGAAEFAGLKISWVLSDESGSQFEPIRGEYFDAERVGMHIQLRLWRPGDRFQPIGSRVSSKLQDFFTSKCLALSAISEWWPPGMTARFSGSRVCAFRSVSGSTNRP
jgi:tRNA(Ile)-lysidine synthase